MLACAGAILYYTNHVFVPFQADELACLETFHLGVSFRHDLDRPAKNKLKSDKNAKNMTTHVKSYENNCESAQSHYSHIFCHTCRFSNNFGPETRAQVPKRRQGRGRPGPGPAQARPAAALGPRLGSQARNCRKTLREYETSMRIM